MTTNCGHSKNMVLIIVLSLAREVQHIVSKVLNFIAFEETVVCVCVSGYAFIMVPRC